MSTTPTDARGHPPIDSLRVQPSVMYQGMKPATNPGATAKNAALVIAAADLRTVPQRVVVLRAGSDARQCFTKCGASSAARSSGKKSFAPASSTTLVTPGMVSRSQ